MLITVYSVMQHSFLKNHQYSPKLPKIGQSHNYHVLPACTQNLTMHPFQSGLIDFPVLERQHVLQCFRYHRLIYHCLYHNRQSKNKCCRCYHLQYQCLYPKCQSKNKYSQYFTFIYDLAAGPHQYLHTYRKILFCIFQSLANSVRVYKTYSK